MDWFSILVTVALGVLMTGFIAMLGVNIVRNLRHGEKYRESLERSVNSLRLGAMAERIGMSSVQLVHQVSVPDLKQQMDRCQDCQHTTACDQVLAETPVDAVQQIEAKKAAVPEFCANAEQLGAMSDALPVAG